MGDKLQSALNKVFIVCIVVFLVSLVTSFYVGWQYAGPFVIVSALGMLMYWMFYFVYTRGR